MKSLKTLLPYFRPYRRRLVAGVLCIVATALIGLMGPLVVGRAVDTLRQEITALTLLAYSGALLLITLFRGLFQYLQRMVLVRMSRGVEFDLRNDLFQHLEGLDQAFYHQYRTGDLMARATNDILAVRMISGPAIMYATNTVITSGGAIAFMSAIDPTLTVLSLFPLPGIAILTMYFGRRIHDLFGFVQERFSDLTAKVQENVAGARILRAYVQEESEIRAFAGVSRAYVDSAKRLIRWQAAFMPLLQTVGATSFVAVLFFGGRMIIAGELTIGQLVTFFLFLGQLVWPMIAIGWVINLVQRGTASWKRIRQILDRPPAIRDEPPLVVVDAVRGAIAARHLTFAYDGDRPPVLHELDFEVAAEQTVAVVGRTGSGKSTLLALIPRLIDPPSEQLLVDGIDVRRLPLATLRRAIAMVPQESLLFSATIRDNIAFGRAEASAEEIGEAAALAGLDPDLATFPNGLDTVVGERGITLSGGQKQRVALARALVRKPRILLLDDCLSAVDTETEEQILRNLRAVWTGRTVVLVSHRISAVRTADLILVLDHGRITERGTHDQLLAAGGIYADLHQRQQLEEELAAV